MRLRYSPDVDILMVFVSEEPHDHGEDNEGIIVHHNVAGSPVALEVLDASQFVLFANASLVTGKEVTNPAVSGAPYTKEREVPLRAIPKGDADLRFNYNAGSDTLTVKFGSGDSNSRRRNNELAVYYDQKELPSGMKIENAQEFVLGIMQSVLLHEEVTVA